MALDRLSVANMLARPRPKWRRCAHPLGEKNVDISPKVGGLGYLCARTLPALALTAVMLDPAHADYQSRNDLLRQCTSPSGSASSLGCVAYIRGAADVFRFWRQATKGKANSSMILDSR
jgi:hypothetical protein